MTPIRVESGELIYLADDVFEAEVLRDDRSLERGRIWDPSEVALLRAHGCPRSDAMVVAEVKVLFDGRVAHAKPYEPKGAVPETLLAPYKVYAPSQRTKRRRERGHGLRAESAYSVARPKP